MQKNFSLNNVTKILLFTYSHPMQLSQISLLLISAASRFMSSFGILNVITKTYSIQNVKHWMPIRSQNYINQDIVPP